MPLSPPVSREHIHTRVVECRGYRRADGLWDIEGHIVDTKTYAFDNEWRGRVEAGTPVHEMWLRLTIDEDMLIHAAEAATDHAPFSICADIAPAFSGLAGLRIGVGWSREVRKRLGGVRGCTHIVELTGPLGTTAHQTLVGQRRRKRRQEPAGDAPRQKPQVIDTCHAMASDGPVVRKEWPEFYTGR